MRELSPPPPVGVCKELTQCSIAAGAFFTLFLARPTSALSDLTRWPDEIQSSDVCIVCEKKQESSDDPLMECERCEDGCHMRCTDPPLDVSFPNLMAWVSQQVDPG